MTKYLVTGGAGFIGSHIAQTLAEQGHAVTVLDNLLTGHEENLADFRDRVDFVRGSITDLDTLRRCCDGVDVIFHQAALASVPRSVADPLASNEHNIDGTLKVFWAARETGVRRVVYAASSSAYGDTEVLPKREDMKADPLSPYAITKFVGELYGKVFTELYGLSTIGLRYFNVFGPRQDPHSQYAAVIPLFITRYLAGEAPVIHGDGGQTRDFTFIRNVVEANLAAAAAPETAGGKVYNIACGERITVGELCERIRAAVGSDIQPRHDEPRVGDVRHSLADISLARELLGWDPAIGLQDGLDATVAWYREQTTADAS